MAEQGKPFISILMAVYEPNLDWLRQQLVSLNALNYPNLRLYVRDDCSPCVPFGEIQAAVSECISSFPYVIDRNQTNLGSNLTFQSLTQDAEGDLFAYCDQDDIWLPEKLSLLQEVQERSGALLVCSDMNIIDGHGNAIATSIKKIRKHHIFFSGEHLAEGLLTHNFVTGCTMLIKADIAKAAIPFCPYMVHDHYLALFSAERGRIESVLTPTICYRQHASNQTGIMSGVTDKSSYQKLRIEDSIQKFTWLKDFFPCSERFLQQIKQHLVWMNARKEHWENGRCIGLLWKYRDCGKLITLFELFTVYLHNKLFMKAIRLNQKNII